MDSTAKRIKQLRKENRMTQLDLGNAIGLKQNTISQYESGRTMPENVTIRSLAKLFNVSESYLRGDTDIREPYSITQEDFESMYSEIYGLIREAKDSTEPFPESTGILLQKLRGATDEEVRMAIHFLDAIRNGGED